METDTEAYQMALKVCSLVEEIDINEMCRTYTI